jgi:hypothetical protein
VADRGWDEGDGHGNEEHQNRENRATAEAIRQHSHRDTSQRPQQNRNCDQKRGLRRREAKQLAKMRGEGANQAPCRETHGEGYGSEE